MNLELNEEEFDALLNMCIMALTVVQHNGNVTQDEIHMNALFNKIVALKPNRDEFITNERFNRLHYTFFHPYLDHFKNLLDEDAEQALEVNEVVDAENVQELEEPVEAEVIRNNFWGRL